MTHILDSLGIGPDDERLSNGKAHGVDFGGDAPAHQHPDGRGSRPAAEEVKRAFVLLAGVLVAHYAYHLWPEADRAWAQYVGRGIEGAAVFLILLPVVASWSNPAANVVGSFACILGALEEAQTAVCGSAMWGASVTGEDLCTRYMGNTAYQVAASLMIAAALTFCLRGRHGGT